MAMHGWTRLPLWVRLFMVSVALNYPWEMGQAFLYVGMDYSAATWWHCFVASLGDGVLVGLIYFSGRRAMGHSDWFTRPGLKPYAIMVASGLLIGVWVEWVAVHRLARWTYTEAMPLIPVLEIGWVPVLQMLILPPLIFFVLAKTVRIRAE
jgi:hypothetical protein